MDEDVDRVLREHGEALADALARALPAWVARVLAHHGVVDGGVVERTTDAVVSDVVPRLRALLSADVDDQRANPLAIVRDAVRHPTRALRDAGVAPPPRQRFDVEHFPDDAYGLSPMTWSDIDESLHEPGLLWGALKARASIRRHRPG